MDAVFNRTHKNAEVEIVVEDDVITTAKVYMDGEFAYGGDVENPKYPNGVPMNRRNYDAVLEYCFAEIDRLLEEDGRTECTNMALVRR